MMTFNPYAAYTGHSAYQQARVHAIYTHTTTPKCEKAFMSSSAFRVLLRSIAGGCQGGRLTNEDGVQLYGWRIREQDGSLSAIITDVVESSPHSRRTSVTFDVDHEYAVHRDRYLRDLRCQKNFNMLGYIHSHPDHMTHFSQTDMNTMAEYTRSDMEVMLSGLVTLYRGDLELTMYVVTQVENQMFIWNLPLVISDEEINRRLPVCTPKPFEQIWREASGTDFIPHFRMLDIPEAVRSSQRKEPDQDQAADGDRADGDQTVLALDISAIAEGEEGLLCGRMQKGTLHLYLKPTVMEQETLPEAPQPSQEAPEPAEAPADPHASAIDVNTGDIPDSAEPDPAKEA